MFRAFNCDSITVPSCDEHNSKKGGNDQAIVSALLIPLDSGRDQYSLEPEIEEAIKVAKSSFERSKRIAVRSQLLVDPPPGLEDLPDLAHVDPSVQLATWVRQLTAGLVYSKIGPASHTISWSKATSWSPHWFPTSDPGPVTYSEARANVEAKEPQIALLNQLTWRQGWSAHPRAYPAVIYRFNLHLFKDKYVMFRHTFYNRYTWYVAFKASKRCITKLTRD
jgi:hypothetical protein